jgi:hypothetical protein
MDLLKLAVDEERENLSAKKCQCATMRQYVDRVRSQPLHSAAPTFSFDDALAVLRLLSSSLACPASTGLNGDDLSCWFCFSRRNDPGFGCIPQSHLPFS